MKTMRAAVFLEKRKIELREVPRPQVGPGEALVKVSLTTICGTDVHIHAHRLSCESSAKKSASRSISGAWK